MSGINLVMLGGSYTAIPPSFMGTLNDATAGTRFNAVTSDSLGNLIGVGRFTNSLIAKYNSLGVIQWQKEINAGTPVAVCTDSSDNIYIAASTGSDILVFKYTSSGTLSLQKTISSTGTDEPAGIVVDSSGNIYVSGYTNQSVSFFKSLLIKLNSSAVIQWQVNLAQSTERVLGFDVEVTSAGTVYVVCSVRDSATSLDFICVAKYNSSGALQWQSRLYSASQSNYISQFVIDSSENIYLTGVTERAGGSDQLVAKFNSSGTLQWQVKLQLVSGNLNAASISIDASSNVYVVGYNSGTNIGYVSKYNSSGTIQWQRQIVTTLGLQLYGVFCPSVDTLYVVGRGNSTGGGGMQNGAILFSLPKDGSKTGVYTVGGISFTYSASSSTASSTSLSSGAAFNNTATSTLAVTTPTYTSSTTTLTSTVTII
jgi:hypothetical protein